MVSPVVRYLIADDLTGAADASVHFAGSRDVRISIPHRDSSSLPTRWGGQGWGDRQAKDLTVLDAETRELPPSEAATIVTWACRGLGDGVFKKVDSTLRGSVAAEVEAARVALGRSTVILTPSLPAQGRMVIAGRLLVRGVDVGSVADIVGAAAPLVPVEALARDSLAPLVVVDAGTDTDLDRIAAACDRRADFLPAGSAGLAAAFARLEGSAAPTAVPTARHVLVAVASRHPAARAQLSLVGLEPHPQIEVAAVPSDAKGHPTEVVAAMGRDVADRAAYLGDGVAVLATGGDMALAVCRALGIESIWPRGEVLPGVVWSETGRDGLTLATKAGGFGEPRLLLDAALKLLAVDSNG
jgi:D-threonate/D-erythronate kinase